MEYTDRWIWLPTDQYPNRQTTCHTIDYEPKDGNFTVAEFCRTYTFNQPIVEAHLRFSGDTVFQLYLNGDCVATGPVTFAGDFLMRDIPAPVYYASKVTVRPDSCTLEFFARVRMMPRQLCDLSQGHGGFMLSGVLTLADGTRQEISTDATWQVRLNQSYCDPVEYGVSAYDARLGAEGYVAAEETEDCWCAVAAPIPLREERECFPLGERQITVAAGEEMTAVFELDKIYAGFVHVVAQASGVVCVTVHCKETEIAHGEERLVFDGDGEYRGFCLRSVGLLELHITNHSDAPAMVAASLISTCYPVETEARTVTDDKALNKVLDVCRHTLRQCRQTIHLDSPMHCEPLACPGDYYIETLMTVTSFGDMRLAKLDAERIARILEQQDGRLFHTSYSLIWVWMLRDIYQFTGDRALLENCRPALNRLLERFDGYVGENGLVETPPDYMFVDWIAVDEEYTLHHPPKALGQTCMNLFYFGALEAAQHIYTELADEATARVCCDRRRMLGESINTWLFDREKGLYFEGLNTPTPEVLVSNLMPANAEKRYYRKHANILAACVGVCDRQTAVCLLHRIMNEEIEGTYQPYFAHFLLEAIRKNGLRELYTRRVLEAWKAPVAECDKGLVEGFVSPLESHFSFDHSHAWGGTPLYSLPMALLGLQIRQPGMRRLALSPSLMGLQRAHVELPTPYGVVTVELEAGKAPQITKPTEIEIIVK